MCKRFCIFICCLLAVGVTAQAATITIVDLPATGTDAAIDISGLKTYTHAFDFGSNAPGVVNGVVFEQGPTGNVRAAFTRTSRQGYRYTLTDTRPAVTINIHAGNDPSTQADGNSRDLLRDMLYCPTMGVKPSPSGENFS